VCVCVWGGGGGGGGGRQNSTGAIARRQAGFYTAMAPASPCSAVPVFLHAQERIRNSELIAAVHKIN
jgi:hypothetical protein